MPSPDGGGAAVEIYDTTLRDGTQREGLSITGDDKLRIARRLDAFGVTFIEGGWPGSNPKDVAFFERARELTWETALISAFGATRRAKLAPEDDPNLQALLASGAPVCTIFGKSWTMQVTEILRTTREENLRMIADSVAFLRAAGRRVIYDAEHFFDGYNADAGYAVETLRAAVEGGAETLVLCDTNGGSLPWDVEAAVRAVSEAVGGHPLGIHAHDDGGLAVANSLAAVRAGARHVQGTINGYGERCGNANLCTIVADLELKLGIRCLPEGRLGELYDLAHAVAEVCNLNPDDHAAYVGRSAFAHKGGVHVSAIRRNADAYQHIAPEDVGNRCRVVVSELSGRANVLSKAEELGLDIGDGRDTDVLERIKTHEAKGYAYEAAEASVALLVARTQADYQCPFEVLDYRVSTGQGTRGAYAEATVKVRVDGHEVLTAAEGGGPVEALDNGLRKALRQPFPQIDALELVDYKVRILDGTHGTSAITRVLVTMSDGEREWSTVGASPNIIEASLEALLDGIEHGLGQLASEDATRRTA